MYKRQPQGKLKDVCCKTKRHTIACKVIRHLNQHQKDCAGIAVIPGEESIKYFKDVEMKNVQMP